MNLDMINLWQGCVFAVWGASSTVFARNHFKSDAWNDQCEEWKDRNQYGGTQNTLIVANILGINRFLFMRI
ncbi:hypothetical protein [Rhizobium sp. YS-1r]|uniref:hypothetical protein n=1 Tax=Rhizobium sp. YS-1r TaxID=1532558 RepID=UPI00126A0672|nr:hypothetical protein [Rhizobium sp. YS-1r]